MSRFYETDPDDPDAPVVLDRWGTLTPDARVRYVGPMPLPGVFTIAELIDFGDHVLAVLDDGEYEVDAENLELVT